MTKDHELVQTYEEMVELLRCSERTIRNWSNQMIQEGVLFKRRVGKPGRWVICCYKDEIKAWYKRRMARACAAAIDGPMPSPQL